MTQSEHTEQLGTPRLSILAIVTNRGHSNLEPPTTHCTAGHFLRESFRAGSRGMGGGRYHHGVSQAPSNTRQSPLHSFRSRTAELRNRYVSQTKKHDKTRQMSPNGGAKSYESAPSQRGASGAFTPRTPRHLLAGSSILTTSATGVDDTD